MKRTIFVFGSNLAGRHSKGAALTAFREHGAVYGEGLGLHGNSYAIPAQDEHLKALPINKIAQHVNTFIKFAKHNPDMRFNVSRIGCGPNGYVDEDIAPLFNGAPDNCVLPVGWRVIASA